MTAMWIVHELTDHYYEFQDLLTNFDFVIIPMANPDGYVFTQTTNRAWVKNRRQVSADCIGADVHRNFQYQFFGTTDPCADDYTGPFFFSESESQAIRDATLAYQSRTVLYLSLQATGQQILFPFSHFAGGPANQAQLASIGNAVAAAINAANNQRNYAVGVSGILRGLEYGTPTDFAFVTRAIPHSFSWRLPSGGTFGWDLPETELRAVCAESWQGFLAFTRSLI